MAMTTVRHAPLLPPSDEEIELAQRRLAEATDELARAELAAKRATETKKEATNELRSALNAWRAIRRQLADEGED